MKSILLAFFLLQAGAQTGTVSGIVRSAVGTPAAGVRVYAQQVPDTTNPNNPAAPLEGLTQTDAAGRYRLDLPVGRYYIASGSVSAPTYYPGTTNIAAARLIAIKSGEVLDGIDFGSFVPASRTGPSLLPPTGTLSGVVRYSDGTPAVGIKVLTFSASVPGASIPSSPSATRFANTDSAGRYRLQCIPLGLGVYIAAGFLEAPVFYPSTTNATDATVVTVRSTPTYALDIKIPFPTPRVGTAVRGFVMGRDGIPAAGATVRIVSSASSGSILPSINAVPDVRVAIDGSFAFSNVVPGTYNVQAFLQNVNQNQTLVVGNSAVTDLRFALPATIVRGRILMDDGRPVPTLNLLRFPSC